MATDTKRHTIKDVDNQKVVEDIMTDPLRSNEFKATARDLGIGGIDSATGALMPYNLADLSHNIKPLMAYPVVMNEFIKAWYNKVGLVLVDDEVATNDLSMFKKENVDLGSMVELHHVNPAEVKPWDYDGSDFNRRREPDVEVAYFEINREDQISTTIQRPLMDRAFSTYSSLDLLTEAIVGSIDKANTIIEQTNTSQMFGDATIKNLTTVMQQENPASSKEAAHIFIARLRALSRKFNRFSTKYNAFPSYPESAGKPLRWNRSRYENQVIVLTDETEAYMDVEVLAHAFHMDRASLERRIVTIDAFTDENGTVLPYIYGGLVDMGFLDIRSYFEAKSEWFNPAGHFYNYFSTVVQHYHVSPFANATILCDVEQLPDKDNALVLPTLLPDMAEVTP